ncbi:MAG: PspC domain-containing protein [Ignavibacteria bacterium]|nr:PspC domain-containing protein [Ignavibacteria bacterium]MBI3765684.1 PspC domain-containing protein [Ignavibacteriales bacterium]
MLPVLLILVGVLFIYIHTTKRSEPALVSQEQQGSNLPPPSVAPKELRRSMSNRKLLGVCSGIAKYFNIDATIVRFLFIFLILASFGWGILLYIILGFLMPEDKPTPTSL